MELSKREREVIRHCIGFDGRSKETYRNHFVTGPGPGNPDYEVWKGLEDRGLAYHRPGSEISGGGDVFWVKRETALAVRNPDEHISRDWRE